MSSNLKADSEASDNELVITRTIDAPRDLVFKAWTQAAHLARWWGPKGFEMDVMKLDLRPGGTFHYSMRAPNGQTMWGKIVYREIVPPEKMTFVNHFSDESGGITRHPMAPTWPLEVFNELTLVERDGKTALTLRGRPINASPLEIKTFGEGQTSMQKGFGHTFDQLVEYLATL